MKVRVDPDLCQGHSRCYMLAPQLFDVDDYGMASAKNDGVVPDGDVDLAKLAISNCPERAIDVIEAPSAGDPVLGG